MSFTLATLKTAVQDYLQVSETTFTNQLDTFIQEAESRIFKLVQLPEQRKTCKAPRHLATDSWQRHLIFLRRFRWQSSTAATSTSISTSSTHRF